MSLVKCGCKLKVLICDPDEAFAGRLHRFLVAREHQVLVELQFCYAADLALRWHPDVVILSSELADAGRTAAIAQLHRIQPRPTVVVTGTLDDFDAIWRARRKGCDEVLFRPVPVDELEAVLATAIESARSAEPASPSGYLPLATA